MTKSGVIMAPITLILVALTALLNSLCCVCSPLAAAALGLVAGGLCVYFEKPADAEKSMVRGAITGLIAGGAALIGETVGGTIILLIVGAGQTPVACLPGLCELASAPTSQTSWVLSSFFSSCFCGLVLLPIMAGMGALGGRLWFGYTHKKTNNPPPTITAQPSL
jgi:hypothetical protein